MTLYTRVFQKMCSLSTDVVVASRMMVPLLGDLSRLWKSEGGGGVFLSLSLTGARKEEQQLYARAFSLASSSTRRRSPKENNTKKTHSAFLFCVEMMICFVVVSKKKKFCGTLLSVESIRIEAHTKREREREREKKPHKKRNKIVSKKRDFFTRSVGLGFRVLLIP